jgi:hypothetical protein
MQITKEFLKKHAACSDGYKYWVEAKKPNLFDFLEHCLADSHFDYANWLAVRCMTRTQRLKYSVFASELALPTFEKEYPEDSRPRKAIEATKKVIGNNTLKNRKAAAYAAFATKLAEYAFAAKPAYAAYAASALVDTSFAAAHAAAYAASALVATSFAARKKIQRKIVRYGMEIMKEKGV